MRYVIDFQKKGREREKMVFEKVLFVTVHRRISRDAILLFRIAEQYAPNRNRQCENMWGR